MRYVHAGPGSEFQNMALVVPRSLTVDRDPKKLDPTKIFAVIDPRQRSEFVLSSVSGNSCNIAMIPVRYTKHPQSILDICATGFPEHVFPDAQTCFAQKYDHETFVVGLLPSPGSTIVGCDWIRLQWLAVRKTSAVNVVQFKSNVWADAYQYRMEDRQTTGSYGGSAGTVGSPYGVGAVFSTQPPLMPVSASQNKLFNSTVFRIAAGALLATGHDVVPRTEVPQDVAGSTVPVANVRMQTAQNNNPSPTEIKALVVQDGRVMELDMRQTTEGSRTYWTVDTPVDPNLVQVLM